MKVPDVDYGEVSKLLRYDPKTGKLFWQESRGGNWGGSEAGTVANNGYRHIKICGIAYLAHRLVWLLTNGSWPEQDIDHINGIRDDNRIENLRQVSKRENQQNMHRHRVGKLVGASFHARDKMWQAAIRVDGEGRWLGYFNTEQEAHAAYVEAAKEIIV